MKKLHFTCLLFLVALFANAQDNKLSYGLMGGLNLGASQSSQLSVNGNSSNELKLLPTFHLGGFGEFAFSEKLSVLGGLTLNGRGARIEHNDHHDNLNIYTLDIPILAQARFGGFFAAVGPSIGFGLMAMEHGHDANGGEEETKITFGSEQGQFKPFNFGLQAHLGYELKSGLFARFGYLADLSNWSNINGVKWSFSVLQLGVGYRFVKK